MDKLYVSVDIEASGRTPGKYSMLSLGACIVGNESVNFYRELKPIGRNFDIEAMKVSVRGLNCLKHVSHLDEFNPEHEKFNPLLVFNEMYYCCPRPKKVMKEFAEWINVNTAGYKPVEVAAPVKFDGMFTAWYFDNFYKHPNPLGHNGENINSMYRGVTGNLSANIRDLGLRNGELTHNALEDAIVQAKEFTKVLELIKEKSKEK
jgi:ribonuclease T